MPTRRGPETTQQRILPQYKGQKQLPLQEGPGVNTGSFATSAWLGKHTKTKQRGAFCCQNQEATPRRIVHCQRGPPHKSSAWEPLTQQYTVREPPPPPPKNKYCHRDSKQERLTARRVPQIKKASTVREFLPQKIKQETKRFFWAGRQPRTTRKNKHHVCHTTARQPQTHRGLPTLTRPEKMATLKHPKNH